MDPMGFRPEINKRPDPTYSFMHPGAHGWTGPSISHTRVRSRFLYMRVSRERVCKLDGVMENSLKISGHTGCVWISISGPKIKTTTR